jgi:hypothetical protein
LAYVGLVSPHLLDAQFGFDVGADERGERSATGFGSPLLADELQQSCAGRTEAPAQAATKSAENRCDSRETMRLRVMTVGSRRDG